MNSSHGQTAGKLFNGLPYLEKTTGHVTRKFEKLLTLNKKFKAGRLGPNFSLSGLIKFNAIWQFFFIVRNFFPKCVATRLFI